MRSGGHDGREEAGAQVAVPRSLANRLDEPLGPGFANEEVRASIEFEPERRGDFQFGHVRGGIDYRDVHREDKPAVEFSRDWDDEMDPAQDRGWAVLDADRLNGMNFFHTGDESEFVAGRDVSGGD